MLRRARSEFQAGQLEAAERSLAGVLLLAPDSGEAIRLAGLVAHVRGDHGQAIGRFRKALAAKPHDPALHIGLGIALYELGEADEAISQLHHACELAPASASAWYNLGEVLRRQVRTEEALVALQQALTLDSTHALARLTLAHVQVSRGEPEAAIREFRQVLRQEPGNAKAWFGLSNLNTVRFTADDAECMRLALERGDQPGEARVLLGFAMGKALEDQGDFARAFAAFQRANVEQRSSVKWNGAREHERVEAIRHAFAGALSVPLDPGLGHEVIQIVSVPRSGSTLVEQILASHPQVEGAGEIEDMPQVADAEAQRRACAFPLWVPGASPQDWHRLGQEYMARTARWRKSRPRFTDKNLVNWYLVGATLQMLPAARIVIVRRDPVETCLACYRQWFSKNSGFAYDLREMADYCIDFMRLTRFWVEKYPDRVFDLEYETLVAEPDATIRRLLDFCGLPFDAACLDFHKTSRTVLSAPSAMQVRQPMRHDTARADRYGDLLDLLRQRLRDAGMPAN
jgi:tetratricopeptide (TPR) repeat protein